MKYISLLFFFVLSSVCYAQTDITIQGSGRLYPIALPQLCLQEGSSDAVKEVPRIVARDLDLSGYFEVLNPNSFIESAGKCKAESFAYSDWSVIGAEGLVKGHVVASGSRIKVSLYLHDVQRQKVVLGKEYEGDDTHTSKIAHRFANDIMKFFTGEYGVFGSQISFSSKIGRFKELYVMDMDGSNIRQLTNDKGLAVSSAWDPSGQKLIYTSYRNRVPDLFMLNAFNRRIVQITRSSALELGPEFSRDGKFILASRTVGRHSDIVLLRKDGSTAKQLSKSYGTIDVSPDWSPDQKKIVFCSNRAGGPQIYTMNSDGKGVKRVSFVHSNYCTSPSWSPKGDRIAFVCRAERGYQIFTSKPDGTDALQLTSWGNNEDPDWSPNGEYLVFATTFGKGSLFHIAMMKHDGSNLRQLTFGRTSDTQPSWGPVS